MQGRNRKTPESPLCLAPSSGQCYTTRCDGTGGCRRGAGRGSALLCWRGTGCPPTTIVCDRVTSGPSRFASASRPSRSPPASSAAGPIRRLLGRSAIHPQGRWLVRDRLPLRGPEEGDGGREEVESGELGGKPRPRRRPRTDGASSKPAAATEKTAAFDLAARGALEARPALKGPRPADGSARPNPEPRPGETAARRPRPGPSCRSPLRAPALAAPRRSPRGLRIRAAPIPQDAAGGRTGQRAAREVRQQIPEAVHQQHLALDPVMHPAGPTPGAGAPRARPGGPRADRGVATLEQWAATGAKTSRPWNVRLTRAGRW